MHICPLRCIILKQTFREMLIIILVWCLLVQFTFQCRLVEWTSLSSSRYMQIHRIHWSQRTSGHTFFAVTVAFYVHGSMPTSDVIIAQPKAHCIMAFKCPLNPMEYQEYVNGACINYRFYKRFHHVIVYSWNMSFICGTFLPTYGICSILAFFFFRTSLI